MPRIPESVAANFDRFIQGPARLRVALTGLDSATFNRRPPANDWSIRDVVMHVTDAEMMRSARFRMVIAHDHPALPAWDEERFKRRLHYLFRDPDLALALFQTARFANAELLQQLDAASWERTGRRESDGTDATLVDLVGDAVEHDSAHTAQVETMRATLGSPANA